MKQLTKVFGPTFLQKGGKNGTGKKTLPHAESK